MKLDKKIKNLNIQKIKKDENKIKSIEESKSKEDNNNIFQKIPMAKTTKGFFKNKKLNFGITSEFPGFFNKKFNLTLYKKDRENTRQKLKSPTKIFYPSHKRGNGIPNNIIDRLEYLGKIFNDPQFIEYYNNRPEKKDYCFDETIEYIVNYAKNHSPLESIMMAFYFVCKEIKFDKECYDNNDDTKYNQKPENVFDRGLALSLGYSNLFEYILKKMEIKFKHIDGYCRLLPKKDKKIKRGKKILLRNQSARNINDEISSLSQTVNHSWNAVFIKGEWYFCDCLFGSGSIEPEEDIITKMNLKQLDINNSLYNLNSNNNNDKSNDIKDENISKSSSEIIDTFNLFYFMIPPEFLINTHRPIDEDWQFISKIISFKQFYNKRLINYGEFYNNVYKNNVQLLTHKNPFILITENETLKIKLRIPDHLIEANLFNFSKSPKITEVKYSIQEPNKTYILEPFFPQKGEYILKINSRAIKSTDLLYCPLIDYIIKVDTYFHIGSFNNFLSLRISENKHKNKIEKILPKLSRSSSTGLFTPKIISDYSKVFPSKTFKKICYDNVDFRLIEPRSIYLRKGVNFKFKVLVKGAINVSLLDGNHLTSLKRNEDGFFVGEKEIETNNVSLCCLRGKNVFTELFKFKSLKERTILSSKPILSKKRKIIFK